MLKRAFDAALAISPAAKRAMIGLLYRILSRVDRDADMVFMNYGFAVPGTNGGGLALRDEDEADRYCIQLYHHLAGEIELVGKDVLEVGSGRGGGASYIARYLGPRSYVGVDRCAAAVEFCARHHAVPRLAFRAGDAEALPFPDASFDVVLNVESSHGYGSMERFLGEVRRVLRPRGHFLYTDHRGPHQLDEWRAQIRGSGLDVLRETEITPNVLEALDRDDDRKRRLIEQKCPRWFRDSFHEFAAMKGSAAYARFRTGRTRYLSFVLRKPDGGAGDGTASG
ncbi:class I SAM-dependent methyltransferase [Longimicrobium sp.]|uniref:class I SAM-dependent methyltransferase n=1 Tax=Longimicrobium sp. TaxID=2029185 RepID=UPI002B66FE9B|nr:methyltransferase domain-containing protein [Longimicrobium sp.]HSU13749.1 methyltransferase domain-containing protein [Longimicrobium sp.]